MRIYHGESSSCDLCNAGIGDQELLYKIAGYDIVKCKGCHLVFVNPAPTLEELNEYYKVYFNSEEMYNMFPQVKSKYICGERHKEGYKTYIEGIQRYKKEGKLLDIGCGEGYLLSCAISYGYDVFGIEPTRTGLNAKKLAGDDRVKTINFEDFEIEDESFDIVTMIGVIEHLKSPSQYLKRIFSITKRDGILLVQTPNIGSYQYRSRKERWDQFCPPAHLFYFSNETIKKCIKNAGFSILRLDMRIPLLAPLNYGTLGLEYVDENASCDMQPEVTSRLKKYYMKFSNSNMFKHSRLILTRLYDSLCQTKGKLIGKHDIVLYARKH